MNSNVPVSPVRLEPVPEVPTYPATRRGWLHQFCSLLDRAEVAREIGRDAMLLILAIAVQEDALNYGSAPIFFDSELQRLTGIRSRRHLDRIRQKAVDAGWLVVVRNPDADQTVARYWTQILKRLNAFDRPGKIGVVSDTVEVQIGLPPRGNDVNLKPAVASQAGIVQNAGAASALQTSAGSCPPDVLSPQVGRAVAAGPEGRLDLTRDPVAASAGASASVLVGPAPVRTLETGTVKTSAPAPATPVAPVNGPVAADSAATHSVLGTTVVAQAAVTTQATAATQPPSHPIPVPQAPKRLSEYSPLIRQQAGDLLAEYPSHRDLEKGLLSICRALEKIPYSQLLPLMKRYIVARDRPGQDPKLTPSAATWFDEERWREGPNKWEVRDRDLLKSH